MHDDSNPLRYATGYVFFAKLSLENYDFSSEFYALALCVLHDLNFSLNHNIKQLNSISICGKLLLKVN